MRKVRTLEEDLGRSRNKMTNNIIPKRNKKIRPSNGFWVGIEMKVFKALYPGGRDGFNLSKSGIPIGA